MSMEKDEERGIFLPEHTREKKFRCKRNHVYTSKTGEPFRFRILEGMETCALCPVCLRLDLERRFKAREVKE